MTINEKIKMFKSKKAFINDINKAFENRTSKTGVVKVDYEVYRKGETEDALFIEYLVVTFAGGAKSVRLANGNSSLANFTELGKLVMGGYYTEVRDYENLFDNGFELINLD